jgi:hypothetical protein
MTYGDGVADVDLKSLLEFHRAHRKLVTVTAVQPTLPFGVINFHTLAGGTVGFEEKPRLHAVWVNSGFFVIEPRALDVIGGDDEAWENGPLEHLAHDGQLGGVPPRRLLALHGYAQGSPGPRGPVEDRSRLVEVVVSAAFQPRTPGRQPGQGRVVVIMPARNSALTLEPPCAAFPPGSSIRSCWSTTPARTTPWRLPSGWA